MVVTEACLEAGRLDELLQPIVDAHHGDSRLLVQILREAQEVPRLSAGRR
jgi:hypothetical protein